MYISIGILNETYFRRQVGTFRSTSKTYISFIYSDIIFFERSSSVNSLVYANMFNIGSSTPVNVTSYTVYTNNISNPFEILTDNTFLGIIRIVYKSYIDFSIALITPNN
jgi:hypothetical protein